MNFNLGQKVRKRLWLDRKDANVIWAGISILLILAVISFIISFCIEVGNKKIRAENMLKEKEQEKAYELGIVKIHESISEKMKSQDWGI